MLNNGKIFYEDIFEDIRLFNEVAGNLDVVDDSAIESQLALIREETKELMDAFYNNEGNENFLKETTDLFVVLVGLINMLEKKGMNWQEAQLEVGMNNLDKYIAYEDKERLEATEKMYEELDIPVDFYLHNKYDVWVVKDRNGKVRKPAGYQKADISRFVQH